MMQEATAAAPRLAAPGRVVQLRPLVVLAVAIMTSWQAWRHLTIVVFPWPLDYRENVVLLRGALVAAGHSPYSQLPFSQSQYGFVTDYLSAPLMALSGGGFFGPRLISAIAILLSSSLLAVCAFRRSGDRLLTFLVFALAYIAGFSHPEMPLAFPNALGSFLFLLSVMAPLLGDFRAGALAVGLLAAWAGFFTKLYPGIGPALVIVYLLVSRAWLKAGLYAFFSLLLLGSSLLAVTHIFPDYFDTTLGLAHAALGWDWAWLLVQGTYFVILQLPLLIFLVWRAWEMPSEARWEWLTGFSAVSSAIAILILLKIGGNTLQYYLYFYQLLFPFLLLLTLDGAAKDARSRHNLMLCLLGSIVVMFLVAQQYSPLARVDASFRALAAELPSGNLDRVLLDPPASFFAIRRGEIPSDDGQTEFLRDAEGRVHALFTKTEADIAAKKRAGYYFIVVTDALQPHQDYSDLARCYRLRDSRKLWLYELVIPQQIWVRKPC